MRPGTAPDPEIAAMRPARLARLIINFVGLVDVPIAFRLLFLHAAGRLTPDEADFVPRPERHKVYRVYALTQHAGLGENVLDHRLNSRTVKMCAVNRFLYWNMNYHVEHHMFPLVPYYRLPELHEEIKHDCAPVYPSIWAAYREIIPAIVRQLWDEEYYVRRELLPGAAPFHMPTPLNDGRGLPLTAVTAA